MSDEPQPPDKEEYKVAYTVFDSFFEHWIFVVVPSLIGITLGRGNTDLIEKGLYKYGEFPGVSYFIAGVVSTSWWIIVILAMIFLVGLGRYQSCKDDDPSYRFGDKEGSDMFVVVGIVCFYLFTWMFGMFDHI